MPLDTSKHSTKPHSLRIEKPWGFEIIYTPSDAPAVGKIIHVNAGKRLSLQYHDTKTETLCLLSGSAIISISDQTGEVKDIPMETNYGYFIQTGQIHRVSAVTDIDIVESSTPEKGNTFRLSDDYNRSTESDDFHQAKFSK